MKDVVEATGHRGVAVCANGALIYDLHTEQVVREHPMDAEVARRLVVALREALPEVTFAIERGVRGFGHEPAYRPRFEPPPGVLVAELDELLSEPVIKVLARHETMDPDQLHAAASEVIADLAELVTVTFGGTDGLLELSAAGVTKAYALEQLASEHGVGAAEVVAFGDMPNDLPMLAWAGHAVAVANAHPDVRAIADEVTATNDEDGVALVVERVLGARRRTPS
jgi:Cof subfamily protein (haloacid dehalogenase superfamily)